jgi:hypothetical protein
MIEWINEHWKILSASIGGPVIIIWGWISAHHGKIRACFRWIRKQFYLRSQNADLSKKLTAAEDALKAKNLCLAESNSKIKETEAQRDILAKKLEPPDLCEDEVNIIRFLAKRGYPIEWYSLRQNFKIEPTRFDFYMNRLTRIFRLICRSGFADTRPDVYELTEAGKAYAVTNGLC